MAPMHAVVAVAVPAVELELARNAAASLILPDHKPSELVDDLLTRLQRVRMRRESRGLNHWEAYAPDYLDRLLVRHESKRRAAVAVFFQDHYEKALARATVMLNDRDEAEAIVAETFQELLEGRTFPGRFYRALWGNIANRWEKLQRGKVSFVSVEAVMRSSRDGDEGDGSDGPRDFRSDRLDDQDPLDALIAREDRAEARRLVEAAMADPRWRYIKRRDWAAGLEENVRN